MRLIDLFEEANYRFELNYIFDCRINLALVSKKAYEDNLRQFVKDNTDFAHSYIGIDIMSDKFMIRLGQVSRSDVSNQKIEELKEVYKKFFDGVGLKVSAISSGIETSTLPSEPIIADRIRMLFLQDTSLRGIEKKLIASQSIDILNLTLIKGGVLSLLKLKTKTVYVNFDVNKNIPSEWLEILRKHLKGDRDIMDCKEELLANNFKEQAKL